MAKSTRQAEKTLREKLMKVFNGYDLFSKNLHYLFNSAQGVCFFIYT